MKPIRIGIAGLGRAGWGMHCEELKGKEDKFEIVAGFDRIPTRLDQMKERYSCKSYEHLEDFLADPEIEAVDIATRSHDHFAHTLLALSHGKHVFLEKPMSLNYEQALKLKEAAAQSQGELFIRHNRRFDPDFLHVREIIESGILGEVFLIKLARHNYHRRDDWQTLKEYGGGQLLNWGPHIVDHALRFLESPVKEIWSDLKRIAAVGDAEDHIKIVLTGENGRVVDLEISGAMAVNTPLYVVCGTKGSLTLSDNLISLKYLDPEKELMPKTADHGTPGETFGSVEDLAWINETISVDPSNTYDIWDELYKSIREGAEFQIRLEEAVEVMRVISEVKKGTPFEI